MKQLINFLIIFCLSVLSGLLQASPLIHQWQTPNGTMVLFVQSSELPLLDIKIAFKAGSAYDGEHFGLSSLTSRLLDQGNGDLNADQIAELFDQSGALFNTTTSRDAMVLSLRTLTAEQPLKEALLAFDYVVNHPNFNSLSLEDKRKEQLAEINQSDESPNDVAFNAFFSSLYKKHPYAHPTLGKRKTVKLITKENIIDFYKNYFVGNNAVIVLVGNIDKEKARSISINLTNSLPKGKNASPLSLPATLSQSKTKHITYPSSQTVLLIGQLGIPYDSDLYFPLLVGNYTLGGGSLVSRLAYEIREKRGLSYGVSSAFSPLATTG